MLKPMGNLTFSVIVAAFFAAAVTVVLWSMPLWLFQYYLARTGIADLLPFLLPPLAPQTHLGALVGAGLATWGVLCPTIWMAAQLFWAPARGVAVPPLSARRDAVVDAQNPSPDADIVPFPAFLTPSGAPPVLPRPLFDAVPPPVEPIRSGPVMLPQVDPVLIIEPAPVLPAARPAEGPATPSDGLSVTDLAERFERRLAEIRHRGRAPDAAAAPTALPGGREPIPAVAVR